MRTLSAVFDGVVTEDTNPTEIEKSSTTTKPTETDEPTTEVFKASFTTDEHASITVSDTQDFINATKNVIEAYACDGATGETDRTGGTAIGAGSSDMAVTPTSATNSQYYVVTSLSGGSQRGRHEQGG